MVMMSAAGLQTQKRAWPERSRTDFLLNRPDAEAKLRHYQEAVLLLDRSRAR
jgi:hypothetical protein